MACCTKSPGFDPKVLARIRKRLEEVDQVFPGTQHMVLISEHGDVLAEEHKSKVEQKAEDLLAAVVAFKKSSLQFCATLKQMECPIMHVRGTNHIFSCYDVNHNILVLFSEMHSAAVGAFNTSAADKQMEAIIDDVGQLAQDLIVTR